MRVANEAVVFKENCWIDTNGVDRRIGFLLARFLLAFVKLEKDLGRR